jgi:hypothetical protein
LRIDTLKSLSFTVLRRTAFRREKAKIILRRLSHEPYNRV